MKQLLPLAAAVILTGCGGSREAIVPQVVNNYSHYTDTILNTYTDTIINRISYVNDTVHENTTHIIHDNHFTTTTQHDTITVYKTNTVTETKTVTDHKWRRRFWVTISGLLTGIIMISAIKIRKLLPL